MKSSSSSRAAHARSEQGFSTLNANMKTFVERWAEGKRTISELVSEEAKTTRAHVTLEGELTRSRVDEFRTKIELESSQRNEQETQQRLREAHKRFLSTLSFPEMNARESEIEDASSDTVDWIIADDFAGSRFKSWLQSKQGPFWISGKAGSGKSTLIKSVVQASQTTKNLKMWRPFIQIYRFYFYEMGPSPL